MTVDISSETPDNSLVTTMGTGAELPALLGLAAKGGLRTEESS
jgi:hypothetical protein